MSALESFVRVQSDAALRQVAGNYAYDTLGSEPADTLTLRNGGDTINHELVEKGYRYLRPVSTIWHMPLR